MSKREFDSNGWYEVKDNPISKSGVFQYLGKNISDTLIPDKIYNVYRPDEELNNPDTINSFKLVPWFLGHTMVGKDFTPAEEVGVQGTTGEQVYFKDGTLLGNIKVYGEKLSKMIQEGIKELSLGYRCEWEIKSGVTPNGESYDVIQKNILGNHLASVPNGRMGSGVAVMDSSSFALDENNVVKIETKTGEDMTELEKAQDEIKTLKAKLADKQKAEDEAKQKAEDMAKEQEAKDADKDEEDKEKSNSMDAAIETLTKNVQALSDEIKVIKSSAVDANSIVKELTEKNELAAKASSFIGAFDHSDMTKQEVAKYAVDKIGIACDSGSEIPTLNGFLSAQRTPSYTVDNAIPAKVGDIKSTDTLNELGL